MKSPIWLTKLANVIRGWIGMPEHPPPVNGAVSVLFVLQSKSPQPFDVIREKTTIVAEDLRRVLIALENEGRITSNLEGPADAPVRVYSIVHTGK